MANDPTIIQYKSDTTLEKFISDNKNSALRIDGEINGGLVLDIYYDYNVTIPDTSTTFRGTYGKIFFCDASFAGSLSYIGIPQGDKDISVGTTIYVLTPLTSKQMSDSLGSNPSGVCGSTINTRHYKYSGGICTSTIQDNKSHYSTTNDGNVVNVNNLYVPYKLNDNDSYSTIPNTIYDLTSPTTNPYSLNLTLNQFNSAITPWTDSMEGRIYIPFLVYQYTIGNTLTTSESLSLKAPDGSEVTDEDVDFVDFHQLNKQSSGEGIEMCLCYVTFSQAIYKLPDNVTFPRVAYSVDSSRPYSDYSDTVNLPATGTKNTAGKVTQSLYGCISELEWVSRSSTDPSTLSSIDSSLLRYGVKTLSNNDPTNPSLTIYSTDPDHADASITLGRLNPTTSAGAKGYYTKSDASNKTGVLLFSLAYPENTTVESIPGFKIDGSGNSIQGYYYIPALSVLDDDDPLKSKYENATDTSSTSSRNLKTSGALYTSDNPLSFTILGSGNSINFGNNSYSTKWNGFKTTISNGNTNITTNIDNWIIMISKIYDNSNTYIDIYGENSSTPYYNSIVKTLYSNMTIDCNYNGSPIGTGIISRIDSDSPLKGLFISNETSTAITYTINIGLPQSYSKWTEGKSLKIKLIAFEATDKDSVPSSAQVQATCIIELAYDANDTEADYEDWYLSSVQGSAPWNITNSTTAVFKPAAWGVSALPPRGGNTSAKPLYYHSSYPFVFSIPDGCSVDVDGARKYKSQNAPIDPGTFGKIYFVLPAKTVEDNNTPYTFTAKAYEIDTSTSIGNKTFTFNVYYDTPVLRLTFNSISSGFSQESIPSEGGTAVIDLSTNCAYSLTLSYDSAGTDNWVDVTKDTSTYYFKINNATVSSWKTYGTDTDNTGNASISFKIPKSAVGQKPKYKVTATATDGTTANIILGQEATQKTSGFRLEVDTTGSDGSDGSDGYETVESNKSFATTSNSAKSSTFKITNLGNTPASYSITVSSNNNNDSVSPSSISLLNPGESQTVTYYYAENDTAYGRSITYTVNDTGNYISKSFIIQQAGGSQNLSITNSSGNTIASFEGQTGFYSFQIQNVGTITSKYKIYTSDEYCKLSYNSTNSVSNTVFTDKISPGSTTGIVYVSFDKNDSTEDRSSYIIIEDVDNPSLINYRFHVEQSGWPIPTVTLTCYDNSGSEITTGTVIKDSIAYSYSSGSAVGSTTSSKYLKFNVSWPTDLTNKWSKVSNELGVSASMDYNTVASITSALTIANKSFTVTNNTNATQENIPVYITVKSYYKSIKGSFTPTSPYTQTFIYYLRANALVSIGGEYSGNYLRNINGVGNNCYIFGPGYNAPGYGIRDFTVYDANGGKCTWQATVNSSDTQKINAYMSPVNSSSTSVAYINSLNSYQSGTVATMTIKATNSITGNYETKTLSFYKYSDPVLTGKFENMSSSNLNLSAADFKTGTTYNDYIERYFSVTYNQNILSSYEVFGDEICTVNKVYDDANHVDNANTGERWYKVRINKNVNTNKALTSTIRFTYNYNESIPDHTEDLTFDFIITVNGAGDPKLSFSEGSNFEYNYNSSYNSETGSAELVQSVSVKDSDNYLPIKWEVSDEETGTTGNEFNVTATNNTIKVSIPTNTSTLNNKVCKVAVKYYYLGTTDHSYDKTEYLTFTVKKAPDPTFNIDAVSEVAYNYASSADDASVSIVINSPVIDQTTGLSADPNGLPIQWTYALSERGTTGNEFGFYKASENQGYLTVPDNPNAISKSCTVTFSYNYVGADSGSNFTKAYTCKVRPSNPINFGIDIADKNNPSEKYSQDSEFEHYFGKNNSLVVTINSKNDLPISWNYVKEESGTAGNEFIIVKNAAQSGADSTVLNVTVPTNTSITSYKSCLITFTYRYADSAASGDYETALIRLTVKKAIKPTITIDPRTRSWSGNHNTSDILDINVSIDVPGVEKENQLETIWEYDVVESGTAGSEFTVIKDEARNKLQITSIPVNSSTEVDKKCNIKFKCYYAGSADHVNDNTAMGVYTVNYVLGPQLSFSLSELEPLHTENCSENANTNDSYTIKMYGLADSTGQRDVPSYIVLSDEYIKAGSTVIGKFAQTTIPASESDSTTGAETFIIKFDLYDSVSSTDLTSVILIKPYDKAGNVGNTCTLSITQAAKKSYKPNVTTSKVSTSANISGNDYNLGFSTYVEAGKTYSSSPTDNIIKHAGNCKILDYGIMIKQQDRNAWTTLWNSTYKDSLIYSQTSQARSDTTIYYSMSLPYTNSILKITPDKDYEYKAVVKATYRDGKSAESEWVTDIISGEVNSFKIHSYKEEDLEYIRPYFKPVEKVNGYTTGVEIKNFLNSKAISFNRKKAKTIDISDWYSNYSISGNTLTLDINNAIIDLVLHTPAFNRAWNYIKDDNLTDFKKLYIKKNIIPNIIINDKCIVELYCDESSSTLGLTSEFNENMVKVKNFKNSLTRSAESDTYKMSIVLDKNKQYYVVLHLNF